VSHLKIVIRDNHTAICMLQPTAAQLRIVRD
jgi:hypothetical protein